MARRLPDAAETLERLRDRNPDFWPALIYLIATYAYLGEIDKASELADTALARYPQISLEDSRKNTPHQRGEDLKKLFDGLAKAGLVDD
ncbi:MAG: hypothetical protein CL569_11525 [Alphaproteobacteria bacterium]|nr:hypothetical protein [Alphaproteobacteria bacterium]